MEEDFRGNNDDYGVTAAGKVLPVHESMTRCNSPIWHSTPAKNMFFRNTGSLCKS